MEQRLCNAIACNNTNVAMHAVVKILARCSGICFLRQTDRLQGMG